MHRAPPPLPGPSEFSTGGEGHGVGVPYYSSDASTEFPKAPLETPSIFATANEAQGFTWPSDLSLSSAGPGGSAEKRGIRDGERNAEKEDRISSTTGKLPTVPAPPGSDVSLSPLSSASGEDGGVGASHLLARQEAGETKIPQGPQAAGGEEYGVEEDFAKRNDPSRVSDKLHQRPIPALDLPAVSEQDTTGGSIESATDASTLVHPGGSSNTARPSTPRNSFFLSSTPASATVESGRFVKRSPGTVEDSLRKLRDFRQKFRSERESWLEGLSPFSRFRSPYPPSPVPLEPTTDSKGSDDSSQDGGKSEDSSSVGKSPDQKDAASDLPFAFPSSGHIAQEWSPGTMSGDRGVSSNARSGAYSSRGEAARFDKHKLTGASGYHSPNSFGDMVGPGFGETHSDRQGRGGPSWYPARPVLGRSDGQKRHGSPVYGSNAEDAFYAERGFGSSGLQKPTRPGHHASPGYPEFIASSSFYPPPPRDSSSGPLEECSGKSVQPGEPSFFLQKTEKARKRESIEGRRSELRNRL